MGLVFQTAHLFDELSALDNAAVAAGFATKAARAMILDRARDTLQQLGIQTQTRRKVATFSGGERQRIGVARALASRPAILLADEPTASLDRTAADRLGDDLLDFARDGGTLVVISHDPALLERMDSVLSLVNGKVAQ
jgi:putative ABC transport system ATP-binding protein